MIITDSSAGEDMGSTLTSLTAPPAITPTDYELLGFLSALGIVFIFAVIVLRVTRGGNKQ